MYKISTSKRKLQLKTISNFFWHDSYWAKKRKLKEIKISIKNSLCFGVYNKKKQIGFARVVSDFSTVYYLADIFILPEYQNKGIGRLLMNEILEFPDLKKLRGILTTQTAHKFYNTFGFTQDHEIIKERIMVKAD